jgi:uncharacterized membrane protein (DUF485 family)
MKRVDINDERSVRKFIRRSQLLSLLYIVLFIVLISWWQQGLKTALVGGAVLYGVLVLMFFIGDGIDVFIKKRRREGDQGHPRK